MESRLQFSRIATNPSPDTGGGRWPIVGIDLGTTNSLVAVSGWPPDGDAAARSPRTLSAARPKAYPAQPTADPANQKPEIVPSDVASSDMVPSVVAFNHSGAATAVGREAREPSSAPAGFVISSAKRLMGRSLADAKADLPFLPYEVVSGEGNTARIRLPAGPAGTATPPKTVSPQEVSAHILQHLKQQAEAALGVPVGRAVVTVPAYFDDAQRQATRDAGRLAGLEVVRMINEPTAAALAYGLGLRQTGQAKSQVIVVYDFGGGTFDVSVLRLVPASDEGGGVGSDAFMVLSTAGDTHLGGDDIDQALLSALEPKIAAALGTSPGALGREILSGLRREAELAKIRLSEHASAEISLIGPSDGRAITVTIAREEFESIIAPLVERTILCCQRALADAAKQIAGEPIRAVVLVGGSTRIPLVRRRISAHFGLEPYTAIDPDRAVALGAAVQAGLLMDQEMARQERAGAVRPVALHRRAPAAPSSVLFDVIPLSLGLETMGGAVAKIVLRNSTVPLRASEMFSTSADDQTSIKLSVYQGEREMAADCRLLGTFHLRGIPPMPAGIPQVKVEFAVDVNGILSVFATELRSGKRASVQIVPNHGLTSDEVNRIERESFRHARSDMQRHRIADLVANSKLDLLWIRRQLQRHGDKLEVAAGAELAHAIAELERFVSEATKPGAESRADTGGTIYADAFQRAKEQLDRSSMRLHEISITESLKADNQRPTA